MTAILHGVRVLEVAEQTFVPSASALLADWGAEVIKVEHVERGDAMRGLATTGIMTTSNGVHALWEHSNRGKKSIGLDLASPEGVEILYQLAATSDVFLTNKLPGVRRKLRIELEQIREHNPRIIYVRGTGQGEYGPEADKGSYDALAFWARSGAAWGSTRPEYDLIAPPPGPGFGDSLGGMAIAGGVLGALYHRERTGEASVVDVSLLGTGMWAMGQAIALSLGANRGHRPPTAEQIGMNPLATMYETADGEQIYFMSLQAAKYWPSLCEVIGRPELATDERFADYKALVANSGQAKDIIAEAIASAPLEEWCKRLDAFTGQWTVVQNTLQVASDAQALANGYVQDCVSSAGAPFKLVSAPIQFDEQAGKPQRAPEFNEHGDSILESLGLDWERIVELKVRGVVA
jgi:crotonobetainyl-CoA:carnitine CoA-transferase CaiB-like acyl-CoA transferase